MKRLFCTAIDECIPDRLYRELNDLQGMGKIRASDVSEIRIRSERPSSLTIAGSNLVLDYRAKSNELVECITKLCKGSLYAHGETIREGYITMGEGIRVGICGSRSADGNIGNFSSVNIRLPHIIRGVSDYLLKACLSGNSISSLLLYSSPGVGKTTLLRDLAARLGGEFKKRVVLIDSRGELFIPDLFSDTICDFLIGYPKAQGIEIATRTLSPDVLICDELGGLEEAKAILTAQNTGVPLIASAHASNLFELISRPNLRLLHDSSVFSKYVGITRERVNGRLSRCFKFSLIDSRDVDLEENQCIH